MNCKKSIKYPTLAYTSHPDYRKPPKIPNPYLQCLGAPHIDSFNYMLQDGLKAAIADLIPAEFELPQGERVKVTIDEAAFGKPSVPTETVGVKHQKVLPTECRQRAATYKGDFKIRLTFEINGKSISIDRSMGSLPIMVKSKMCHLADLSPEELIKHNEHADEWGGYFIIKVIKHFSERFSKSSEDHPNPMIQEAAAYETPQLTLNGHQIRRPGNVLTDQPDQIPADLEYLLEAFKTLSIPPNHSLV